MKENIKNSRELAEEIRNVRLKKAVKKQEIISDFRVIQHQVSSVEAGFEMARNVINIFKGAQNNQMPPGEKIKNMVINTVIDVANDFLSKRSEKDSSDKAQGE